MDDFDSKWKLNELTSVSGEELDSARVTQLKACIADLMSIPNSPAELDDVSNGEFTGGLMLYVEMQLGDSQWVTILLDGDTAMVINKITTMYLLTRMKESEEDGPISSNLINMMIELLGEEFNTD